MEAVRFPFYKIEYQRILTDTPTPASSQARPR
jgi:hypothetical protein